MDDRSRKAKKISSILQDYCGEELISFTCLDLGCSRGVITDQLAKECRSIVGIDIDRELIKIAQNSKVRLSEPPYFVSGDGNILPFLDGVFDVVICAQVYEHTTSPAVMVKEITRVLKPGGFCFFSGPNRLEIMEEHYWLPFLSWLPQKVASLYMKIMNRGDAYDIYPMTYWQLIRLWSDYKIIDYSLKLLRDPHHFYVEERVEKFSLIRRIPDWLLKALGPCLPNFNWIVIKRG